MFDLAELVRSIGYLGVFAIVFAECGLLIGFFLPGDSLLFTAGFLASQGLFNPWTLTILIVVASIAGNQVGYVLGHKWGRRLFERPNSRFFKHENLIRAELFYERWGRKTIMLARFVPVIRTFAPIVAGIGRMPARSFLWLNVVSGILWGAGVTLMGYWLGSRIPSVDRYLLPIIGIIVVLSIVPGIWELLRDRARRNRETNR